MFQTRDGGQTWLELPGPRGHGSGSTWQPGAGGLGLHTIVLDASEPGRMFIAISAAGAFRTNDGGRTWAAINRGLRSQYIPDPDAEVDGEPLLVVGALAGGSATRVGGGRAEHLHRAAVMAGGVASGGRSGVKSMLRLNRNLTS